MQLKIYFTEYNIELMYYMRVRQKLDAVIIFIFHTTLGNLRRHLFLSTQSHFFNTLGPSLHKIYKIYETYAPLLRSDDRTTESVMQNSMYRTVTNVHIVCHFSISHLWVIQIEVTDFFSVVIRSGCGWTSCSFLSADKFLYAEWTCRRLDKSVYAPIYIYNIYGLSP